MREFKGKNDTPIWKRIIEGFLDFFFSSHRGTMGDHEERMKKRRRKTKFHK